MKKSIYTLAVLMWAMILTGCEKEEIGSTAMADLSGEWLVTVDAVDADGNVVIEDPFGIGQFLLLSYNNNANSPDRVIIDDLGSFWGFTAEVNASVADKSFAGSDVIYQDEDTGADVTADISGGRIVANGTKSPLYNMPVDAIEFYISFSDDPYPAANGYDLYRVSGFRRTGFEGED